MATKWLIPVFSVAALVLSSPLAACGMGRMAGPPETPAERTRSVELAVRDIVMTRCDLEERCQNIGGGQRFERRDTCESKLQGTTAAEVNLADCPLGVDPRKLDVCLSSIRAEDCGSIFDALSRWNSCRKGQLCYH